jgi:hypothetical protein
MSTNDSATSLEISDRELFGRLTQYGQQVLLPQTLLPTREAPGETQGETIVPDQPADPSNGVVDLAQPDRKKSPKHVWGLRGGVAALIATIATIGALTISHGNDPVKSGRPLFVAGWVPDRFSRGVLTELIGEPAAISEQTSSVGLRSASEGEVNLMVEPAPELGSANDSSTDVPPFVEASPPEATTQTAVGDVKSIVRDRTEAVIGTEEESVSLVRLAFFDSGDPEQREMFSNWKGRATFGRWRVRIASVVEPAKLERLLRTLTVNEDGEISLEPLFDGDWQLLGRVASAVRTPLVLYPGMLPPTTPETSVVVQTIGATAKKDGAKRRSKPAAPDFEEDGRAIFLTHPFFGGPIPLDDANALRTAIMKFQGVVGEVSMRGTKAELLQVARSITLADESEIADLAHASAFAVGSTVLAGNIIDEGTRPDGSKWRVVRGFDLRSTGGNDAESTLLGVVGVESATVDLGVASATIPAEAKGIRLTNLDGIYGVVIVAVRSDLDPRTVSFTAEGQDRTVAFVPYDDDGYRYAFLPAGSSPETVSIMKDGKPQTFDGADLYETPPNPLVAID